MSTVVIPAKILIGLHEVGPSSFAEPEGSGAQFAEQLWRKFVAILADAGAPMNLDMYGVSWPADESTPPQSVHYFCGFEYAAQIDGLTELALEGGRYFDFKYEGQADQLDKGFEAAYFTAFPASGLREREGQHLEIYGADYDPTSPIARFRILIPVAE